MSAPMMKLAQDLSGIGILLDSEHREVLMRVIYTMRRHWPTESDQEHIDRLFRIGLTVADACLGEVAHV